MIQSLVVHVVFVVLKTTTNFVLQYRKQQIQPIQLPVKRYDSYFIFISIYS